MDIIQTLRELVFANLGSIGDDLKEKYLDDIQEELEIRKASAAGDLFVGSLVGLIAAVQNSKLPGTADEKQAVSQGLADNVKAILADALTGQLIDACVVSERAVEDAKGGAELKAAKRARNRTTDKAQEGIGIRCVMAAAGRPVEEV